MAFLVQCASYLLYIRNHIIAESISLWRQIIKVAFLRQTTVLVKKIVKMKARWELTNTRVDISPQMTATMLELKRWGSLSERRDCIYCVIFV